MLRFILPSLIWTILVIVLSLSPTNKLAGANLAFEGVDKVVHFLMYLTLTLFWVIGLKRQNKIKNLRANAFIIAGLGSFLLSVILEVIQEYFIFSRHFEVLDLIANGFGCIFGVLLFKVIYRSAYK